MIPNDPVMLLSFLNLKLRDYYDTLEGMCQDLELDIETIQEKLATIDYVYDKEKNQFI